MRALSTERRAAVLLAMIGLILLMALVCAGIFSVMTLGLSETVDHVAAAQAVAAAETGVALARECMATNFGWTASSPVLLTGSLARASFCAVLSSAAPAHYTIVSTGMSDAAKWTTVIAASNDFVPDAVMVYRDTAVVATNPHCRVLLRRGMMSGDRPALLTAAPALQRLVASPTRTGEVILVTQNSSGWIWVQTWQNGVWSGLLNVNSGGQAPVVTDRGFDVAYEQGSGRAVVVYSDGTATPKYRIWDGSVWSAEGSIALGAGAAIRWVRLVAKPGSNEMIMIGRWRAGGNFSSAIVWDGSSWGSLCVLESNCTCGNTNIDREMFDVAYGNNMALVVYENGSATLPRYRTFSSGIWAAESNAPALPGRPIWIRCAYSADGSQAFSLMSYASGGNRLSGAFWNGVSWGGYTNFTATTALASMATRPFDLAWNSQSNMVMVVYALTGMTNHSFMTQTVGGDAQFAVMPSVGAVGRWCSLASAPGKSGFLYGSLDALADVYMLQWTPAGWAKLGELTVSSDAATESMDAVFVKQ